jgi:hypothetical protein
MLSFTLDTNCLIDILDDRPMATYVRALGEAHRAQTADVALVSISASERQRDQSALPTFTVFENRVAEAGLAHVQQLLPMAYWGLVYWDHCIWSDEEMGRRERLIHSILFPSIPFSWADFAAANKFDSNAVESWEARAWRNAFCDRQMFWAHDHHGRDVFVTSDANFRKRLNRSAEFATARIMTPMEAAALLSA